MNPFAKFPRMCEALGKIDMLLVTALDQIAWVLNLRGNDIEFNPVFFSYLVWYPSDYKTVLFCDEKHFGAEALEYLELIGCTLKPYDGLTEFLAEQVKNKKRIGVDLNKCNSEIRRQIDGCYVERNNVIELLKAQKTPTEVQGM